LSNQKVIDCIYAAIDEINEDRGGAAPLAKSLDTPIHGSESELDSLGLVNFVVMVEENVEREFDVPVVLGDDRALSSEPSPFESVGKLAEYVEQLLQEQR
jgi:acyl carrier protein